jgi:hypothetical protein
MCAGGRIIEGIIFSGIQAIGSFHRFCQGSFAINIFITGYLDNRCVLAGLLQFDNGHILAFLVGYQRLYDKELYLVLLFIDHPQVIDIAIPVQVKVIDLILLCVQQPFKFFGGIGLFKERKRPLQAEVIAGQPGRILVGRSPAGVIPFVGLFL